MFYEKKGTFDFKNPSFKNSYHKNSFGFPLVRFFLGPKNFTIKGYQKKFQLGFSLKIKVPQLGSARLGSEPS